MRTRLCRFRHQCGEGGGRNQTREQQGFHLLHPASPIKSTVSDRVDRRRDACRRGGGRHADLASLDHWGGYASSRRAPSNDGRHSTGRHATQL